MGGRDWLASWVAWAVFVPRVTIYFHGWARGCVPPPSCLVRSGGRGLGFLRGARRPVPRCLREGDLFQGQPVPLFTQPGPVRGAPLQKTPLGWITAGFWNHFILHELLLLRSKWRPQHPDFGSCGRKPANIGMACLGSLSVLISGQLFECWGWEKIGRERQIKCLFI